MSLKYTVEYFGEDVYLGSCERLLVFVRTALVAWASLIIVGRLRLLGLILVTLLAIYIARSDRLTIDSFVGRGCSYNSSTAAGRV